MVLFMMLYKVVLICESVEEILKCDHSNESYLVVLSVVLFLILFLIIVVLTSLDEIPKCELTNERC